MFIRQTKTSTSSSGQSYFTYRLVTSKRVGKKVRQQTLLNLGRHFDLPREHWPELCMRLDQILVGEKPLFETNEVIEQAAQHIYSKLMAGSAEMSKVNPSAEVTDFQEIDVNSIEMTRPRSVGVEHVCLEALKELNLPAILDEAGFNTPQKAAALGNIVGRMCQPRSERATSKWLANRSALGELLGFDFESMPMMQLYRASDLLLKNKALIEQSLFERAQSIFGFTPTVTLYDLTNTYFEGTASGNSKAKRGRSKEKRNDCPLVTLGLTLDASGFIRHSEVFDGNVSEGSTLEGMLEKLNAPEGALVIMDAGIASEKNITSLANNGYKYLVVSRRRKLTFEMEKALSIQSASDHTIHLQREEVQEQDEEVVSEVKLYCWSEQRARKDSEIDRHFREKFEAELNKIAAGLRKKGYTKRRDKLHERIGRLKERCKRVSHHYRIELVFDDKAETVTKLNWHYEPSQSSKQSHPGVYCLRSNQTDWDDEALWRTYTLLTDVEAVFRSLKSELGMRPIYHHKEARCDGHLFITVLAYQAVQVVRRKLKEQGICESWVSLRELFAMQHRVTTTFKQRDGRILHVRKASVPEEPLLKLYKILGLDTAPGGIKKMII
jgi:transposase